MNAGEISKQLFSADKAARADAAKTLGEMGSDGVVAVLPLLLSENWVLRYRAAEIIGFSGCSEYVSNLLPLLFDEKDHVRYMAVKSLGILGGSQYQKEVEALASDENPFVARMVSQTLAGWNQ